MTKMYKKLYILLFLLVLPICFSIEINGVSYFSIPAVEINKPKVCYLNVNQSGTIYATDLIVKNVNISDNLIVGGNITMKRAYLTAIDNTTQNFINTANTQVVNISKVLDNWQINIEGKENITFTSTGDYILTFMPILTVTVGSNKHIEFWYDKWNGTAWNQEPDSNTRIEIPVGAVEVAQSISYHFDITNISQKIRMSWYSDSTSAQILYTTNASTPTRPAVPSVILNIMKISDLTD